MKLDTVSTRLRVAGSVFAEEEAELLCLNFSGHRLCEAVRARERGMPLEHIIGLCNFAGLKLHVMPGVFVPRRRTELLVHEALDRLPRHGLLVELCCGAAPVAVTVATARADVRVHASDLCDVAVECARDNLSHLGGTTSCGDLGDGVPLHLFGRVDVLAVNAPYVPTGQLDLMPREARQHEPLLALDGGPEGLDVQARVAQLAPRMLRPGGALLLETSRPQIEGTMDLLVAAGLETTVVLDDDLSATCVVGIRPGG